MASTRDTEHLGSTLNCEDYSFAPGATTLTAVAWKELKNFDSFLFTYKRTVGTGVLDYVDVAVNSQAGGGGTDVIIKVKDLAGVNPDAVDDRIRIEVAADEIQEACDEAGVEPVAISLRVQNNVGTDEGVVGYIFGRAHFAQKDLTGDVVS